MEQVDGGSAAWFAGLPGWMWLMIAAVFAATGFVVLTLSLARMSHDADLRVRGWERRVHDDDDEWWKREYPEVHDG